MQADDDLINTQGGYSPPKIEIKPVSSQQSEQKRKFSL